MRVGEVMISSIELVNFVHKVNEVNYCFINIDVFNFFNCNVVKRFIKLLDKNLQSLLKNVLIN